MRDIGIILFLLALLGLALKRPFLFTLAYIYVDTVSPQRISYYLLNSIPLSMIVAVLAIGSWLLLDSKKGTRVTLFQCLLVILILYAGWTTQNAVAPIPAKEKWDWVWKGLLFAAFLPFVVRTRLRVEAALLFLVLSAGVIIISAGIKTLAGGGGYGRLNLMVDSNTGLYEGSIISTFAIAVIPIVLWFTRHGTIFPPAVAPAATGPGKAAPPAPASGPARMVKYFCAAFAFACLLIPIGTEARTGLVCIGALAVLMLRDVKRRFLYLGLVAFAGTLSLPLLPQSFQERMGLIQGYQQDSSAASRLAVWQWAIEFAGEHPTGGGFGAYHTNRLEVQTTAVVDEGGVQSVVSRKLIDEGRAWHSAYFEMLGEQGYPGLLLFLAIQCSLLLRMELIRRRYAKAVAKQAWIAPLATALQHFQIIYLVGAIFSAIAVIPFVLLVMGVQTGFALVVGQRERSERGSGGWARPAAPTATEHPAIA